MAETEPLFFFSWNWIGLQDSCDIYCSSDKDLCQSIPISDWFLHCNVKIKRFSRLPALRFVAPGSVRAEEDQDQARGQGSLQCWRGKWRGWTARTRSCSPPCSHGNQPGKQIWNILRPTWIVGRRPAKRNTLMVVVLKVTWSSCKDFTSKISNRQT